MTLALADILAASDVVYANMKPTPQYRWPLLCEVLGCELWVKHENHTPLGAFKVRGGLVYFDQLANEGALPAGVISATRGNHGQSVAYAAGRYGVPATIVVPHGNSVEKNYRMAIRRPVTTAMLFLTLLVFGWRSYQQLPVNLMPDISYPTLTVRTEYEGAAPEDVEKLVTRPLVFAASKTGLSVSDSKPTA